jgi:DNA repair protein RecN (Recombination protein N)
MLSLIRVKNYAVVDEVELELDRGFSVVTGETGAGKSILVDALGLALGDRAAPDAVRSGAERAEISVRFDLEPGDVALEWLRERGLDDGTDCTLRRLIGAEERSRAFINGQPATLLDVKTLGALLIDIHGQQEHQSLLEPANQRALLDAHGKTEGLARDVAGAFAELRRADDAVAACKATSKDRAAQVELLRFQLKELEAFAPIDTEPEQLFTQRERLANIGHLMEGVVGALEALVDNDSGGAYSAIVRARLEIERLVGHDAELRASAQQLGVIEIELREIESSLNRYRDRLEADPQQLERLDERLAQYRSLARRHACAPGELAGVLDKIKARLARLDADSPTIEEAEAAAIRARQNFFALAKRLSTARAKHAEALGRAVTAELTDLGMPHGEFRVDLQPKPDDRLDATGLERVEFQVRLNPGQPFGPLARMASGGELSRLSLAIEVVRSDSSRVPTFVFDEVDSGVGGRVADIVGRKLGQLGARRQVLCVTHLPQVASQGQRHYRVIKSTDGKSSRTKVSELTGEERVEELSRMLGGVEITERTRAHAAEMIDRATK